MALHDDIESLDLAWAGFRKDVLKHFPDNALTEPRWVFYAGAVALWTVFMTAARDAEKAEDPAILSRAIDGIERSLDGFSVTLGKQAKRA